ncbi:MAG TPA: YigZ family protein [Pseudogracilibacillus sp.]|nr:YigZ family protein [Pseudogracilibacillus sp.]
MLYTYYTVKQAGSHEIIIQKSRFIGYVERVTTEEEAIDFIQKIKKKHHNATHNCSAYIIGDHDQIQKANDDGEPSGTAGIPMLEVLKRLSLKNTAVVVTRYFGGIKLGAGGLIRAYSSTTSEAIKKTGIVKGELMQGISLTITYPLLGKVENKLQQSSHIIDEITYTENVELNVYVHTDNVESFKTKMINLTNDQVIIRKTDKKYIETEISI